LYRLGVLVGFHLPVGNRTLIQPQGGHDRWHRAAKASKVKTMTTCQRGYFSLYSSAPFVSAKVLPQA
jgi:hypothetical protein